MWLSTNDLTPFLIHAFSFVEFRYFLTVADPAFGGAAFESSIIGCASRLLFRTLNGWFVGQ